MKTPADRLEFKLAPYLAFHQHTARDKRALPWEVSAIDRDASHLYLSSGDRNYSAALFMTEGRLAAWVTRAYASRKDKLAFYGHDAPDYLDHMKRTVLHERVTALFREYSLEQVSLRIHAALGTHSPFCTASCAYEGMKGARWDMSTEPEDRYTFGK